MRVFRLVSFSLDEPRDALLGWPSCVGTGVFPTGTYLASDPVLSLTSLLRSHSWGPPSHPACPLSRSHVQRYLHASPADLTACRRYYEAPDFSLRTGRTFQRRLIARPVPPAL